MDPNITLALVLGDLLKVLLYQFDRTPADPEIMAALARIDNARQELQRSLDQQPTKLDDPRAAAWPHNATKENCK